MTPLEKQHIISEIQLIDHDKVKDLENKMGELCRRTSEMQKTDKRIEEKLDILNETLTSSIINQKDFCINSHTDCSKQYMSKGAIWKLCGGLFVLAIGAYGAYPYIYTIANNICK